VVSDGDLLVASVLLRTFAWQSESDRASLNCDCGCAVASLLVVLSCFSMFSVSRPLASPHSGKLVILVRPLLLIVIVSLS
jgi:hypothetical protein